MIRLLLLFAFFWLPTLSHAQPSTFDYGEFAKIPMLHDGRVKPLDSFARSMLVRLHGKSSIDGTSAITWLAESLFRPDQGMQRPFIHVSETSLRSILRLKGEKDTLYTYAEIASAYEQQSETITQLIRKEESLLNKYEKAFLELYMTLNEYSQVLRAMTLILPNQLTISEEYAESLGIRTSKVSFMELQKVKERVTNQVKEAVKEHGETVENYSPQEQQAALLSFQIANLESTGFQNRLFRVIPAFLGSAKEWHAPWALILEGHGSPYGSKLLLQWQELAIAYLEEDVQGFHSKVNTIHEMTASARHAEDWQLALEVHYHALNPVLWIMLTYLVAFALYAVKVLQPNFPIIFARAAFHLSIGLHIIMIAARIAILMRAPVSTLYESILFVSFIVAITGMLLNRRAQRLEINMLTCAVAAGLLYISQLFTIEGDSLNVVIAVLNTQFWLTTHVICITIGYGACLIAAGLSHLYLLKHESVPEKHLKLAALIALFFTAIGTQLGGIWADQSWGRFWGWDPKENGALAIVIWLVWALHGRISNHLQSIGFAAVLAFTSVIVALSWFGVNLLNVGLHSYGFTDKAAYGLAAFCLGETLIILALTLHANRNTGQRRHAN